RKRLGKPSLRLLPALRLAQHAPSCPENPGPEPRAAVGQSRGLLMRTVREVQRLFPFSVLGAQDRQIPKHPDRLAPVSLDADIQRLSQVLATRGESPHPAHEDA